MNIQARIDAEYAALLSHQVVLSTQPIRRTETRLDGYLRVRCTLFNGDFLEIAFHVLLDNGQAIMDDYRYQWMNSTQTQLIRRWDNTPHFPNLPGFPHHCHVGDETTVEPSKLMDVETLLDTIATLLVI